MENSYTFPPEYYEFQRDEQSLFFDPQNFVWFKTDALGKKVVNSLARERSLETVAEGVARSTGGRPENAAVYVEKWIARLLQIGFLHEGTYERRVPVSMICQAPSELYLHLTSRCNLRCVYCYNLDHRDGMRKAGQGAREQFFALVDEAAEIGIRTLRLTGGEALLNPHALAIARRAKERQLITNLLTNGTLITPERAGEIAQWVDLLSISLDSADPEEHDRMRGKGSHARVVRAIGLLKQAGVRFLHVNAVVTPLSKASVPRFLQFAWDELDADQVTLAPSDIELPDERGVRGTETYVLTPEDMIEILEAENAFYAPREEERPIRRSSLWRCHCGVGNGIVSVEANGDVYPCQTLHTPDLQCGNAFRDGLRTVIEQSAQIGRMKELTVDRIPGCDRCAMRYICGGGCRMNAYYRQGDIGARDHEYCKGLFRTALNRLWDAANQPLGTSAAGLPPEAASPLVTAC